MACVTLKRPLEWIDPSMSPESGSSSPTNMIISNSPPHHGLRSPKRLCLQSISTSSSSTNSNNGQFNNCGPSTSYFGNQSISTFFNFGQQQNTATLNPHFTTNNSYIANTSPSNANNMSNSDHKGFKPISSSEIAEQIRDEMLRLRSIRRSKAKLSNSDINEKVSEKSLMESSPSSSPSRQLNDNNKPLATIKANTSATTSTNDTSSASSQHKKAYKLYANIIANTSANSSSSSEDEENDENNYHHKKILLSSNQKGQKSTNNNSNNNNTNTNNNNNNNPSMANIDKSSTNKQDNDKRLFTFNQVCQIVERLLRDKEEYIRQEYDALLTTRLAEQYEQFVKFTYDQIQRRFDPQALPSYLS